MSNFRIEIMVDNLSHDRKNSILPRKYVFRIAVFSVELNFSRNEIIKGVAGETIMTCSANKILGAIQTIQALMYDKELNEWMEIGKFILIESVYLDFLPSANKTVMSGTVDDTNSEVLNLKITFNTAKLECSDSTLYKCSVTYSSNGSKTDAVSNDAALKIKVIPAVISMSARSNGSIINGLSPSDPAACQVGDRLDISCTANIGSIKSTKIQWRKVIMKDKLWTEREASSEGIATSDSNCGYNRTATLSYIITQADSLHSIGFECYVRVNDTPYNGYYMTNRTVYVNVHTKAVVVDECEKHHKCTIELKQYVRDLEKYMLIGGASIGGVTALLLVYSVYASCRLKRLNSQGKRIRPKDSKIISIDKGDNIPRDTLPSRQPDNYANLKIEFSCKETNQNSPVVKTGDCDAGYETLIERQHNDKDDYENVNKKIKPMTPNVR